MALGGDNSITYAVTKGLGATGLVTLDAHHDLRDGPQRFTGSATARRRIRRVACGAEIGIGDFADSREYAQRAAEHGVTVIDRDRVDELGIETAMAEAIAIASGNGKGRGPRRSGCGCLRPQRGAGMPGVGSRWARRSNCAAGAATAGRARSVVGIDLTEVDASADSPDGRTVRLVALCVLEAAAALLARD